MPEGPSIVILKESISQFNGKKVLAAYGNGKIDVERINKKVVRDFKSWGKHFLVCFDDFYLRIHFLMFGSYRINEKKDSPPRLSLKFKNGALNFYSCSVKMIEGDPDETYDYETDVMSDNWNPAKAEKAVKKLKKEMVSDVLLNQEIFSGVGNIIKNEVLFRIKVHPESVVEMLPETRLKLMVREARNYSFDFYEWKKLFELRKHWLVYKKQICPRCVLKFNRTHIGKTPRLTFFCSNCQVLYKMN